MNTQIAGKHTQKHKVHKSEMVWSVQCCGADARQHTIYFVIDDCPSVLFSQLVPAIITRSYAQIVCVCLWYSDLNARFNFARFT